MSTQVISSIKIVPDVQASNNLLDSLSVVSYPIIVSFVNAHAFNMAWTNKTFDYHLCFSDMLLRDGIGIAVMLRVLGIEPGINMNGTDLIPRIAQKYVGKKIMLCGSAEPYLSKAASFLNDMGCTVIATMDGFKETTQYVQMISEIKPDLVILAMGMPKQEAVSYHLKKRLNYPVLILNGGAIVDFWAKRFPRAPILWQKFRLEWLFRLIQEPKRLWRRYLLGGVVFLVHIVQLRIKGQK